MATPENSSTRLQISTESETPLILRVVRKVSKHLWHTLNKAKFGQLGAGSWIRNPLLITGKQRIHIGSEVQIWPYARLETIETGLGSGYLKIGASTVIQPFVHIAAAKAVTLGEGCLLASHVYITDHDHAPDPKFPISKSPFLNVDEVHIGDGVWIGERAMILKGVCIGDKAIIGAAAVVTKNVAPGDVVAGVPARPIQRIAR